jgi:hypothetical protein
MEGRTAMYWLKGCPKCRGDLHEEMDIYGVFIACIQCGYVVSGAEEEELRLTGRIRVEVAPPVGKVA